VLILVTVGIVVVAIAAPFDHWTGLGGAASNAPNNKETGKGSDGVFGTSGDGTSVVSDVSKGEFAEREKNKKI
jgi:hypothetical protein